ncbi:MAG: hypothetical protein EPO21_23370 [Chloroflexota bacterium]|nr:MAG: hypothetical protein EPO21_23370 [Chloroflexota bacterium]
MATDPQLLIFVGGLTGEPVVEMVGAAQRAVALDTVARATQSGAFAQIVLVTDSPELAGQMDGHVTVEMSGPAFVFGRRLRDVIERHNVRRPFYMGGGGLPLLSSEELARLAKRLSRASGTAITNNLFSSDLVAFTPGRAITRITVEPHDNALSLRLRDEAGLRVIPLPRNATTQFDLDTPTDLAILKVHPACGPRARAYLNGLDLDTTSLTRIMTLMTDTSRQLLVAGRMPSYVWSYIEQETACRVRVLSEERGMRADGREDRGEVRSLVGLYYQQVGPRQFFRDLSQLGDAAIIDSRVLFGHLGLHPSPRDRFNSDLLRPDQIEDAAVRTFTEAALTAPIPIVLGGHSVVSGGLWALVEAAWAAAGTREDA